MVLPLCCASLLLGGCGWHLSFVADRRCWCFSFGALWLLPALGCLSFGGCVWCLLFGALGFLGLLPGLGCLRLFLLLCLALVLWGSGASARPGVFVFFPCVVVLVFVFWRSGASACFAAFLFLLVAAVGMGPTALRLLVAGAWRSEASACPGCLCSFCVFFPWVVVLVFVFWRFGASACGEVSFCFLFWWFCPSVMSLFFLVAGLALSFVAGRCCWCFSFGALWLLPALGCVWFGGWGRCLLIGALGLLPALG